MSVAIAGFALSPVTSFAEETKAESITMKGTATCPKCDLGTSEKCGNVLLVKEGDTTITYLLAGKADMAWHKNICKGGKPVKATGTVTEKDGEKTFKVTEITITEEMEKDAD